MMNIINHQHHNQLKLTTQLIIVLHSNQCNLQLPRATTRSTTLNQQTEHQSIPQESKLRNLSPQIN
jgi:hypothetical protein